MAKVVYVATSLLQLQSENWDEHDHGWADNSILVLASPLTSEALPQYAEFSQDHDDADDNRNARRAASRHSYYYTETK